MPLIRVHRAKSKPYRYWPVEETAFLAMSFIADCALRLSQSLTTERLRIPAVLARMSMGSTAGGTMRILASSP